MPADPKFPLEPTPKTLDQIVAELYRENERLRRQVADAQHERDEYKNFYLGELARNTPDPTPEEIAAAVPAGPLFESLIRRLENP